MLYFLSFYNRHKELLPMGFEFFLEFKKDKWFVQAREADTKESIRTKTQLSRVLHHIKTLQHSRNQLPLAWCWQFDVTACTILSTKECTPASQLNKVSFPGQPLAQSECLKMLPIDQLCPSHADTFKDCNY